MSFIPGIQCNVHIGSALHVFVLGTCSLFRPVTVMDMQVCTQFCNLFEIKEGTIWRRRWAAKHSAIQGRISSPGVTHLMTGQQRFPVGFCLMTRELHLWKGHCSLSVSAKINSTATQEKCGNCLFPSAAVRRSTVFCVGTHLARTGWASEVGPGTGSLIKIHYFGLWEIWESLPSMFICKARYKA